MPESVWMALTGHDIHFRFWMATQMREETQLQCGKSKSISVLIVDEHPVIRWGLNHLLEAKSDFHVLGETASISEAIDQAYALRPDVTIMDICMGNGKAFAAVEQLCMEGITRILAFTERETWDCVETFLATGGTGYISKRCPPDELLLALVAVSEGRPWISPSLRRVADATGDKHGSASQDLSPREREIATLVARGLTSRQIATQLCVSLKTVETHRYRIFKELQISSRAELVNYVIENGLLSGLASHALIR
ncbi:MAG: response regulator transcription factor [Armatimonadota bacterium]|nr:response regulator transcription factor [bacterium]